VTRADQLPGLFICGENVAGLYMTGNHPDPGEPVWSWNSSLAEDLPAERRSWLAELDDVKPVTLEDGRAVVLVTASSEGGAAVVERDSGRVIFSGRCPNAHSIELLPGGLLAVAGSVGTDELQLWRLADGPAAEAPVATAPLEHAHGAVWEPGAGRLWTCGADKVVIFRVSGGTVSPSLGREKEIDLSESGAHDLLPDPCGGGLVVSTSRRCWRIDPGSCEVAAFRPLERVRNVKAVSVERGSGTVAFQKAEESWWSENVYLLSCDGALGMITIPGRRLYKCRWDQPCRLE